MASKFPPPREADLLAYMNQLCPKLTATPVPFGITAAQAA